MAKKRAMKKAARKAAPKRKSGSKKSSVRKRTTKKTAKKSLRAARKPARKVKSASARAPKRAAAKKRPAAKTAGGTASAAPVPYNVDPGHCSIVPDKQHFRPFGSVMFDCSADCTLEFSDSRVLGFGERNMYRGMNGPFPILVANGETEVWIKDCAIKVGPADIIVP
jgi:hypothetical protein